MCLHQVRHEGFTQHCHSYSLGEAGASIRHQMTPVLRDVSQVLLQSITGVTLKTVLPSVSSDDQQIREEGDNIILHKCKHTSL